ncbi:MAG: hypothetical protein AAFX87_05745 [Bacteroidota bacterium]
MNKISSLVLVIFWLSVLVSCQTLDSVEPSERSTFIKFFNDSGSDVGAAIEPTPDGGFISLGTSESGQLSRAVLVKTDRLGNTEWTQSFENASGCALLVQEDGYLIVGDSINILDANETLAKIYLFKTDLQGNMIANTTIANPNGQLDVHGKAVTVDLNGDILVTGDAEDDSDLEETVLANISAADFSLNWIQRYELDIRSYDNGKSLHQNPDGSIIWCSSVFRELDDDRTETYVSVNVVPPDSESESNALFGRNVPENFSGVDIRPGLFGFGVIGTMTDFDNQNGEIFFIRVDQSGLVIDNSELMFGNSGDDFGYSLSLTSDGGFILLGGLATTPESGNGGLDYYLVKIDAFGNIQWDSLIGGAGDEIGGTVRQTADGGYVIFGTSLLQGVSSMVLVKTNSLGQLVDPL